MMNKTGNWWWPIPKERLFVLTFLFCESSFIVRLKRVFFLKIFALFVSNFMKRHYSFLHFCFVSFVGLLVGVSFNQIKKQNKKKNKITCHSTWLCLSFVCVLPDHGNHSNTQIGYMFDSMIRMFFLFESNNRIIHI